MDRDIFHIRRGAIARGKIGKQHPKYPTVPHATSPQDGRLRRLRSARSVPRGDAPSAAVACNANSGWTTRLFALCFQ
jgi:hypothetical protein